ncbi:hypothetical protein Tco_1553872 [Tanacetum coccineum]
MAQLEFCDKHNMVAYLVKSESSEGFDEIIDFLTSSHIYYALTKNSILFVSVIEQFWETAILSTTEEGLQAISATINGYERLITEDSLRRHLKLDDAEGISSLSNEEIFKNLAHMGISIFEKLFQNGNGPVSITTDTQGQIKVLPPRTAEEILAKERERKATTTLLMALPEDHLAKFHKMTDAKEMWDAIKSRFGGKTFITKGVYTSNVVYQEVLRDE